MRNVVITGGSAGIGRAAARAFAKKGYSVAVIARDRERLEDTEKELTSMGVRCCTVSADVGDHAALEAAAETIEAELGPIDIWVNNAMTTVIAPFRELKAEDVRRVMEVNYLGQVHGTMIALDRMKARGRGAIVNVGSGLAYRAIPLQSAYCASKHAVKAMSEAVRTELRHEGSPVTISLVHPSGINTPQFDWTRTTLPNRPQPTEPIYPPESVARAIIRAAETGVKELFVGLPAFGVSTLAPLMPELTDRQLASSGWDDQTSQLPLTDANRHGGYTDEPVEGNDAAHGSFDHKMKDDAAIIDGDTGRFALLAAGFGAALLTGVAVERMRRRFSPF
ncbi:MAG: SDR family oxidoreductase [Parvularcula sp.]|jgi:short-subunit dehydrogenase|nr:SDR family oxidoreductase [Parvularcula sp.]